MDYHPVQVQKVFQTTSKYSSDSRYWRSFKHPLFIKEYAPITSVHFSPTRPHKYAVTVGTQVQIYTPRVQRVSKTISRFKDTARSGRIRPDGKLLAAADDTGLIQVFDLNSRAILRTLSGHNQPTHTIEFSPLSSSQLLSGSDDTSLRLWDIPSQSSLTTFRQHTDYIRTCQVSSASPHIVVSGSYDRTVRLFDTRSGECEMTMGGGAHFQPVEQVIMFPGSTLLASSSGSIIRLWDLVAGGRCRRALSNHQKTITALRLSPNQHNLLSASLDRLVKVYDIDTFRVVHTMRYAAPVLSLDISPDETHLVAGMLDGTLSIRQKVVSQPDHTSIESTQAHNGGIIDVPLNLGEQRNKTGLSRKKKAHGDVGEMGFDIERQRRLRPYDKLLKSFKYSMALDAVLAKDVPPTVTFALISELQQVGALRSALAGRDDVWLNPILVLLLRYVSDPRFGKTCCDVYEVIIDMYSYVFGTSPLTDGAIRRLQKKVSEELRFQAEVLKLKAATDMILTSTSLRNFNAIDETNLQPAQGLPDNGRAAV